MIDDVLIKQCHHVKGPQRVGSNDIVEPVRNTTTAIYQLQTCMCDFQIKALARELETNVQTALMTGLEEY